MAFDEPVDPNELRDSGLVESAANRPFQSAFCIDVRDTLYKKAAALFHSIVCNHCFSNGNKRTAVLALDMFCTVNGYVLLMSNQAMYELAKQTARHNEDKITAEQMVTRIAEAVESDSIAIEALSKLKDDIEVAQEICDHASREAFEIRNHPLNVQRRDS